MFKLIDGKFYETQGYGLTSFAKSAFGKKAYKGFAGGIHPGRDYGTGGKHSRVFSSCDGKVVKAKLDGGWGNHIEIQCADGWNRQYAHLHTMNVKVGDEVKRGDYIGTVGTTGASTGIHLHYGHRKYNYVALPIGKWEYRDPNIDLKDDPIVEAKMPTGKLIKGKSTNGVYVFNGKERFGIPSMNTLTFLFGEDPKIEVVDDAILSKIPERETLPLIQ